MSRVLLTGAGGYIGSNAAEYFVRQGFEVTGTVRNRISERFSSSGAKALPADLYDFPTLDRLFAGEPYDYVLHIAARASDVGRDGLFRIANFEAVKHLAALSMKHRVKRFVFLSTADVYGLHDFHGESEEELAFDHAAANPYPKYKIRSEEWLAANLPPERFSCVRPCAVWGNGDTTLTPRALAYLKSTPLVLHFGKWKGRNRWPLAHVGNVCRTLHAAMLLPEAGGKGVTVLDSEFTTVSGFYRMLAEKHLPGKAFREATLPVWTICPAAWLSGALSTLLNRDTPLFDPTLYALATITHNLDFSNARMREWMSRAGLRMFPEPPGPADS